jgi:hypothetical protein
VHFLAKTAYEYQKFERITEIPVLISQTLPSFMKVKVKYRSFGT